VPAAPAEREEPSQGERFFANPWNSWLRDQRAPAEAAGRPGNPCRGAYRYSYSNRGFASLTSGYAPFAPLGRNAARMKPCPPVLRRWM